MRSLLPVALLAVSTGCAGLSNQRATAEYARQVTVASTRVAQVESELHAAQDDLKRLMVVLKARNADEAEKLENLEQVNREIARLRGRLEELTFRVDDLVAEHEMLWAAQEERQLSDEIRLDNLEQQLGVTTPELPEDGVATGSGGTPSTEPERPELPATADEALEVAAEHMRAGRQGVARFVLQQAEQAFPGADELAEVRYRIGETWFNDEKYGQAVQAFETVITKHRTSPWAAWSMLRQGEAFGELGQADNATLFFEEVVRLYAKTDAAEEARRRLADGG